MSRYTPANDSHQMNLRPPACRQWLAGCQIPGILRFTLVKPIKVNLQDVATRGLTEHVEAVLDEAILVHIEKVALLQRLQLVPLHLCSCFAASSAELCTCAAPTCARFLKVSKESLGGRGLIFIGFHPKPFNDNSNITAELKSNSKIVDFHHKHLACWETVLIFKVCFHWRS